MKKIIAIAMLLNILLGLAACAKNKLNTAQYDERDMQHPNIDDLQLEPQNSQSTEEGWLMTRMDMPVKMPSLVGMDNDGDWIWISGRGKIDDIWYLLLLGFDTVNERWQQFTLGLDDIGVSNEYDIRWVSAYSLSVRDGMAWMHVDCTSSDGRSMTSMLVTVDTATGETSSTNWAIEKALQSADQYTVAFVALNKDNALIVTSTEACIIDRNFNSLTNKRIDAYQFSGSCKIGNQLYLTSDDGITFFDEKNLCLDRNIEFVQDGGNNFTVANSLLGNIIYSNGNKLYSLEKSGQRRLVFDWMDVAISRDTIAPNMFENSRGEFYGCAAARNLELVKIEKTQIPVKDSLIMACFFDTSSTSAQTRMTADMSNAILSFNNSAADYRITPIFFEYSGEKDLSRALIEAFGSDIDLVDQSNIPEGCVSGAQLLDMLTCLDSDSELNRTDFFPAAIEGMSFGGHLYRISPYFSAMGLNIPIGLYPNSEEWSCQFLEQAIANDPSLSMGMGKNYSSDYVVNALAHAITGEFIDLDSLSCDFTRQDFAAWLGLMTSLIDNTGLAEDRITFTCGIDSYYSLKALYASEGVGLTSQVVGFPNSKGCGFYLASPAATVAIEGEYKGINTSISIVKGCKNEQAAWKFVKLLLNQAEQGIPVLKSAFEDLMAFNARNYSMSHEDIDALRYIAENATGTVIADPSLILLITEELNAYIHGAKTTQEISNQLQNRVNIYLAEHS